jgi:hypothetical protein
VSRTRQVQPVGLVHFGACTVTRICEIEHDCHDIVLKHM